MKFSVITIFPEAFDSYLNTSIIKRAQERKLVKIAFFNPRDFTKDKHKIVDDKPFGGGPGMVIKAEPILKAVDSALRISNFSRKTGSRHAGQFFPQNGIPPRGTISKQFSKSEFSKQKIKIILLSAKGRQFNSKMAVNLSKRYKHIILISGRYEGVDERVKKILKAEEISIGSYVLTGGELPSAIIIDAVSRHTKGVLGKSESLEEKHGSYPVYTRPETVIYKNKKYRVPKVLLSGDHKKVRKWREKHSLGG